MRGDTKAERHLEALLSPAPSNLSKSPSQVVNR